MLNLSVSAQEVIDKIIAVVGEEIVLHSEVETQYEQYLASGMDVDNDTRCLLFEELLLQKLLLHQAALDSIMIDETQIQTELERRIRYFVAQFGSEKRLEEFYNKSILELKNDFHDLVEEQLLIQNMQANITQNVKVTPAEVKAFFETIPQDSLPFINSEIEIAHIVRRPPINEVEKAVAKEKLENIRERVLKGENFGTLAYLYSEDPGSAQKNGELGFMPRTALVPEFSSVAFKLKPNEVSEIVETKFGYHLIQLIERRGEEANVRHILVTPKVNPMDMVKAKLYLDSISSILNKSDTLTFAQAASLYSDDEDTKQNGGKLINFQTGTSKFQMDQLGQMDPSLSFALNSMKVGDVAKPSITQLMDGSKAYRLVKLIARTEPHKANLVDDYQLIQDQALMDKQNKRLMEWVSKKAGKTYLKIDGDFFDCDLNNDWNIN